MVDGAPQPAASRSSSPLGNAGAEGQTGGAAAFNDAISQARQQTPSTPQAPSHPDVVFRGFPVGRGASSPQQKSAPDSQLEADRRSAAGDSSGRIEHSAPPERDRIASAVEGIFGGLGQSVGGFLVIAGAAAVTGPLAPVVAIGGLAMVYHGADTATARLIHAATGEQVETFTSQGLQWFGMGRERAEATDSQIGFVLSAGATWAGKAGLLWRGAYSLAVQANDLDLARRYLSLMDTTSEIAILSSVGYMTSAANLLPSQKNEAPAGADPAPDFGGQENAPADDRGGGKNVEETFR